MRTLILAFLVASAAALGSGCAATDTSARRDAGALSRAQVEAIVASPDRSDADRRNDVRRKPVEMLSFIGVRPGMVVLDVSAGGGYTTELLARSVAPSGRVYGQTQRPPGAALAARLKTPAGAAIVSVVQPFDNPVPADVGAGRLDLVTLMFNYHDFGALGVDRARLNAAVFAALKPGGAYVVADHVDVSRGNAKVVGVDKAGPILMLKLAPGEYAIETSYLGRTARRQVRVGAEGTQLDWRLPDPPK